MVQGGLQRGQVRHEHIMLLMLRMLCRKQAPTAPWDKVYDSDHTSLEPLLSGRSPQRQGYDGGYPPVDPPPFFPSISSKSKIMVILTWIIGL